ncbi:efflux transporter outer membrane subunit [Hephaestia sp. GCM10023244]|uniref:efflux transporter outer membrane subunit n=1 Tax=unclassified Hephaestia TaxID=2631281 RepID=UPI0020778803|nr:efflux transporter outer membrane subunit [Hephaestia sp. MAHUQ-44]MCM8730134.1 efflux transporter outer membrane subunit [Hephaestia sp. MAHUQ-44]
MSFRPLFAALAAGSVLAGCVSGPDFERPAAPSTTSYRSPADPVAIPAPGPLADAGQGPVQSWWTAFGSTDLDALVARAIANNHSLAASNATLQAAIENVNVAAGKRLPQVDANARIERQQPNLAAFGFQSGTGNPEFNLYSVGGGVSYDLDLFGGRKRAIEQAAARADAQRRQTEAAHLSIAGRVVNQVLTIAAIRDRIDTADALLREDQRNVDLTEKRRQAGEGTLVEVLNAQSQYEADRGEIPQLGQQLAEARHLLAILVGVMPADLGPTDFNLADFTLPADVPVTLPSELVHKRPDILQAEAEWHAATAAIGVATARLYPDITLGVTGTQGAPHLGDVFSGAFRGFDIFAGLTAPIFHGGTLNAQKRAAVDEAEAAQAQYRQTVLEAFGQVADLLQALDSDARSVANQRQAIDVAQRSLHLSRRSFEVGNSGVLQILESERLYQRARSAMVDAEARQYLNVARLYVATAGGWTGPVVETAAQ